MYPIRMLQGLAVTMIVGAMTSGCASSEIQTVKLELPRGSDATFYVLPFEPPAKRLVAREMVIVMNLPDLLRLANSRTYTLDDQDLGNLRQSLVRSIEASKSFDSVQTLDNLPDKRPINGLFLAIRLDVAGVVGGWAYSAVIKGSAKVEGSSGNVLGETAIEADETGVLTLNEAKNKAIKKVVGQAANLLSFGN
jgi:hypothetical protein